MGKLTGFKEYNRKNFSKRKIEDRKKDYKEVYISLSEDEMKEQASRCMNCGTPFCNYGCTLGNIIPDWNDLFYRGKWKQAYDSLTLTSNFPEITARICPALCEGSCTLAVNRDAVSIREIEYAIIEKAFEEGYVKPNPPKIRTGKNIAIVGSGPAGMSAAIELNSVGHTVDLYEKDKKLGGILRYGIPDFKLEKWVIDRRLKVMEEEGVILKPNTLVGKDLDIEELLEYDAILLTGGCSIPRDLNVIGRDTKDVHFAMDFLTLQNRIVSGELKKDNKKFKEINAKDKVVVVIGGGDTGSDCVGTSIRQGAKKVYQFEIMPCPSKERDETCPWPDYPRILKTTTSHEEGCERRWNISTKELISEDGNLKKIKALEVEWSKDENGRFTFKEKQGSEFELDVDMLIIAMGFTNPNHCGLIEDLNLDLDPRGNVKADNNKMTNVDKVFTAGDMSTGQSLVVKTMHEGRVAAKKIDEYLMGDSFLIG
ncbi:MAG: glutamate synthase subunit beta [Clostridiaceae bacterium]